ncbi:hypothetical protein [Streptomyces mirabilis]|uniref:Acetyltransferase (GNAT) domain-containing protein n=1 Tax=Streptomyces mirabilis TaxID=68239 RepID=A0ABU3UYE5_9ACTN|nr:hypothetical protein [Streptomyces mirabilis]MDU8998735.1 hypothetical protein [Streptomyces mirabilis]
MTDPLCFCKSEDFMRSMLLDLWARADYEWRYSTSSAISSLHMLVDETARTAGRAVLISTPSADLRVAVTGLSSGIRAMTPFLKQQLSAEGSAAVVTELPLSGRAAFAGDLDEADITVLCDTGRRISRRPQGGGLVLPGWVHQVVPTQGNQRLHKSDRQRFAKQRRENGWTWEVAQREEDFEFFFTRMHSPMVANRFGDHAISEDRRAARVALFRRGILFFLLEHGERVGGALCRVDARSKVLYYRLNGLLDGDHRLRKSGALVAISYFLVEWGTENRLHGVDLSGSIPFFSRGVYQAKRRLHPDVVLADVPMRHLRYRLAVKRDTSAVRDFLVANPLLRLDGSTAGAMEGVYFTDSRRPLRADLRSGVEQDRIVDLDETPPQLLGTIGASKPCQTTAKVGPK